MANQLDFNNPKFQIAEMADGSYKLQELVYFGWYYKTIGTFDCLSHARLHCAKILEKEGQEKKVQTIVRRYPV